MIENQEQLLFSRERLDELKKWEERAVNDLNLDPRLKQSKLAGIRSMMAQIERDIRAFHLSRLQNTLDELEEKAQKTSVEQLPALLSQTIHAIRELTNTMQPVA
jgi:hypothetical protein